MGRKLKNRHLHPDQPLKFEDHGRPLTRRQFIRQGFLTGGATILTGGLLNFIANPRLARADVATDLQALASNIGCTLGGATGSLPFICFDLAGGANFAGSNVLVGGGDGQLDLLSTAGYSKLGLPGDMLPGQNSTGVTLLNPSVDETGAALDDFTNRRLKLAFHADSALLHGILEKTTATTQNNVDGFVIPARSDNDTGNNPHNPLYGIAMTGARGEVVDLIGSRASESGGNSMAPAMYVDPEFRPTKVDRPSDVTGLVDVGDLTAILNAPDVTSVMEAVARITHKKLQVPGIDTGLTNDAFVKNLVRCGYLKASDIADNFAGIDIDPLLDTNILSIFSANELMNDGEFRKTASVMKMVLGGVSGYAAGGCITMGGYDYHTGDRTAGENRDLRAGRCIGACLEYAQLVGKPLMIYVFSDGSVASNGRADDSVTTGAGETLDLGGQGKGEWTGDNSSTACSFVLAYSPAGSPPLYTNGLPPELHRQMGRMDAGASVVTSATPMANNVNILVNSILLNYMAMNGQVTPGDTSAFTSIFPNHGLGGSLENYIAFSSIV